MIGRPSRTVSLIGTIILGLLYAIPLLWIVLTSLKSDAQVLSGPNALIFTPSLDAYRAIISAGGSSILTSLEISVATTALVLLIAVPAAYGLARHISDGWSRISAVVLGVFLVMQMVPQPMAVIPLYGILADLKLVGTLSGLVLVDVALLIPFAVLLLRPFVLSIPRDLYEAAQIDGATQGRTFISIVIPMLTNGVATVASIVFILAWGEFIYATTLITNTVGLPVSGLLAQQTSLYSVSWNRLMGLALLTSLPLVAVFLIAKRRLVEGLSVGAVK